MCALKAVDSEAVDSEAVDSEAVATEAVATEAVATEAVATEAVDSEAVDSEVVDSEVRRLFLRFGVQMAAMLVGASFFPDSLSARSADDEWNSEKRKELWEIESSLSDEVRSFLDNIEGQLNHKLSQIVLKDSVESGKALEAFITSVERMLSDYIEMISELRLKYADLVRNHHGRSYDNGSREEVESIVDEYKNITGRAKKSLEDDMKYLVDLSGPYFEAVSSGFRSNHRVRVLIEDEAGNNVLDQRGGQTFKMVDSDRITLPRISTFQQIEIRRGRWYKIPLDRHERSGPFVHIEAVDSFVLKAAKDGEFHIGRAWQGLQHFRDLLKGGDDEFLTIFVPRIGKHGNSSRGAESSRVSLVLGTEKGSAISF